MMRILVFLAALFFAFPAYALDTSTPDTFVRDIYNRYTVPSRYLHMNTHKQLAAVFTPDLVRLIEADRRNAHGEVPKLDGDPFVDAQEWELSHVRISIEQRGPALATAFASFHNLDRDATVTLHLVKGRGGWRVNEVVSPSGSLRELLSSP